MDSDVINVFLIDDILHKDLQTSYFLLKRNIKAMVQESHRVRHDQSSMTYNHNPRRLEQMDVLEQYLPKK